MLHLLALTEDITHQELDWTVIIIGLITTTGSTYAAWATHRTNNRIRTNSGKTIGQHVETMEEHIANTAKAVAVSLEEARLVREHEQIDSQLKKVEYERKSLELELARNRVAEELVELTTLLKAYPIKRNDTDIVP